MMRLLLGLVAPLFNLFLLWKGGQIYEWIGDWLLEKRISGRNSFQSSRQEIIELTRFGIDVNALLSGMLVSFISALFFVVLEERPTARLVILGAYAVVGIRASMNLRDMSLSADMSGYDGKDGPNTTKAKLRGLRVLVVYLSLIPPVIAVIDGAITWVATTWPCLSPLADRILGSD